MSAMTDTVSLPCTLSYSRPPAVLLRNIVWYSSVTVSQSEVGRSRVYLKVWTTRSVQSCNRLYVYIYIYVLLQCVYLKQYFVLLHQDFGKFHSCIQWKIIFQNNNDYNYLFSFIMTNKMYIFFTFKTLNI